MGGKRRLRERALSDRLLAETSGDCRAILTNSAGKMPREKMKKSDTNVVETAGLKRMGCRLSTRTKEQNYLKAERSGVLLEPAAAQGGGCG
jgi:hypothetical protein